jgi:hypothetical protein
MTAGINHWEELMKASLDLVHTSVRTNEMLAASGTVIASRMGSMAGAVRNPWGDDHVELGRMVPEKVTALLDAGNALAKHWSAVLENASHHVQEVSSSWLKGTVFSPAELARMSARTAALSTSFSAGAWTSGGVGLAPIHKQATSNAKRLSAA